MAVFFYFFLDFDAGFLNSLYSISAEVNASNAEAAVINPGIRPSENNANNTIANIKTMVIPRFLANTFSIFSKVFMFLPFVWMLLLYHKKIYFYTIKKNDHKLWPFYFKRVFLYDERGET